MITTGVSAASATASARPEAVTGHRIAQIDGLRGAAASVVMGYHLTTRFDERYGHADSLAFHVPWGNLGVQLFFAISGFVILMTLRNAKSPMDFVVSRFSRLYPTYWACLLITAALLAMFPLPDEPLTLGQVAWNFLMFHGRFGVPHVNGTYWTLEVELIFYVLMLLLWTLGMLRRPMVPVIAWLAVCLASRSVATPWVITHLCVLDYLPWFGIGISVYVLIGRHDGWRLSPIALGLSAATISVDGGVPMLGWAVVVTTLLYAAAAYRLTLAGSRPLIFLGAISYPLYLLHEYLSYAFMLRAEAAGLDSMTAVGIAAAASIGLAYAVHRYAETPSMQLIRARYRKRQSPSRLMWWRIALVGTIVALAIGPRLIQ